MGILETSNSVSLIIIKKYFWGLGKYVYMIYKTLFKNYLRLKFEQKYVLTI